MLAGEQLLSVRAWLCIPANDRNVCVCCLTTLFLVLEAGEGPPSGKLKELCMVTASLLEVLFSLACGFIERDLP